MKIVCFDTAKSGIANMTKIIYDKEGNCLSRYHGVNIMDEHVNNLAHSNVMPFVQ